MTKIETREVENMSMWVIFKKWILNSVKNGLSGYPTVWKDEVGAVWWAWRSFGALRIEKEVGIRSLTIVAQLPGLQSAILPLFDYTKD